jgi:hypothetical protein
MDTTKLCRVCQEEKSLADFNKDATKKDGHQSICRSCKHSKDKDYSLQNKDTINQRSRQWRKGNKERQRENTKRWKEQNPERYKEIQRKHWKKSYEVRGWYKNLFVSIKRALKNGWPSKKIFERLGYTPDDLRKHLESKFKEGMTWDNHGEWHIDHIIPQSWLPFDSIEDENFLKCWSLDNLQPLWAKDNISKQDRYIG